MNERLAQQAAFDLAQGTPNVLGASPKEDGTNFAIWSGNATRIELCLFDDSGETEVQKLDLPAMEGGVFFGFAKGVKPGQVYGYRVHGDHKPEEGHRFNPAKLLLDPYAREITGNLTWDDALFGYPVGGEDVELDPRDSAPFMPKGVVVDPVFDWDADRAIDRPWSETVIYEAHVKGLTKLHPGVPEPIRGTFEALGHPAVIEHLTRIGVTAVELLPIHSFVRDRHLIEKGLTNYWGYNTLNFFSPERGYLHTGHVAEVKEAIRRLHRAGIEVILDVVYNHTGEGSELGPTLSYRGIDNASYYLLSPDNPRHAFDTTGTGNTLNVAHPMVLRMVLDSLRYWVEVFHVDGFRFDLASTLAREPSGFEREGTFFNAIRQDPVLSRVKLIAEPWDIGDGGYQVGGFPWPFREWNDKFRDDIRSFWKGNSGQVPRVSQRLLGSPVQFSHSQRPATSSVNFLAAHDGFTLRDTVSYSEKQNAANGEDNRDGHSNNHSDDLGASGPTDDPAINQARLRRQRAMLAALLVSQGVPMLLAGDEMGQSQKGNNNAYCQDNELSWLDWSGAEGELSAFVAAAIRFRQDWASYLAGPDFAGGAETSLTCRWLHPEGREMGELDWKDAGLRCFGLEFSGEKGRLLLLLNAGFDCGFRLSEGAWEPAFCSLPDLPNAPTETTTVVPTQTLLVLADQSDTTSSTKENDDENSR
jgi:isoamylase